MMFTQRFVLPFTVFLTLFFIEATAQQVVTPRPSPDATVTQMVGVTKVSIDYGSPAVNKRVIWGELVPYNEVWRTGANELTTITFDDPVKINGTELPAGTFGIHSVPRKDEWDIIFSKDARVDGPSSFNAEKEILRVKAKPEEHHFMERMTFLFTDVTDNSAVVNLLWDKLKVSFTLETNTQDLTLTKARQQLSWSPLFQAAQYCLTNNVNLDEGLKWIEASCLINEVYWNTRVKAQIQNKLGMKKEAVATMEKAIDLGNKMQNPPFDFEVMKAMLSDWKK
ncbi:MAG: DUF2911 domain-containing protein [Ignavibacterium sp.]|nr:DUF2911 domain-containing protein [Ignavibacterium sp.]